MGQSLGAEIIYVLRNIWNQSVIYILHMLTCLNETLMTSWYLSLVILQFPHSFDKMTKLDFIILSVTKLMTK